MKRSPMYFLFVCLAFVACRRSPNLHQLLLKQNWKFKAVDDSTWMPATVPGSVHTDLMDNGIIEDPFYRLNELDVQWVDKKDWEFQTHFSVDEKILKKDVVELNFKGLDTYAKVYLNDQLILDADNMFVSWQVDCKKYLKLGENKLSIVFESPITIGLEKRENLGYWLPGAENDQSERGGVGDKKTCVFTRKAQYHFGWDWGPRLVSMGIWQDVELNAWDKARIRDLNIVQQKLSGENADLVSNIEIESIQDGDFDVLVFADSKKIVKQKVNLKKGLNKIESPFQIQDPELWWPNGLGDHKLYKIEIQLKSDNKIISSQIQNIGLRTIEDIQQPDSIGASFYFQVNGHPVFMKGANYIPQDVFLNRVSEKDYEKLIQSAVEANFNMLRIWGGGIYEKDIFYDLCDKNGILVWQDFMFACAMYPGNAAFLDNVKKEAEQNVKRLRNHPCLALWCGDNEILSAWGRWGWQDQSLEEQEKNYIDTVWHAYDTVFHHILPEVVRQYDPQKLYWSSSPSSGFGQLENGKSGDNHYWGVWWAKEPFSKYKEVIPRFMSEYGFQSFPELNSIKKYALEEDWDIESEVMQSHQRSSIGNVTIAEYMQRDFRDPKDFPMFLYVNHVLQAEGIKMAIEAHRRNMPFCMGSLYWQINDCWPVASWSGIDNFGNWKAMHYFVKKAFEPILVSPDLDSNNQIKIFVVSDRLKKSSASLKLRLMDFEGKEHWSEEKQIEIEASASKVYFEAAADQILNGKPKQNVLLWVQMFDSVNSLISENVLYFDAVKNLNLPLAEIKHKIEKTKDGFTLDLSTDKLAKNLYLRADEMEGHFSDNYFDLLPGESVQIGFLCQDSIQLPDFEKSLKIFTLVDTY
jgi:beta-mannosidase